MLIMDQSKGAIVNTDTLACINIDRIMQIRAVFATPGLASVCLGSYNSYDDCNKVLADILRVYNCEGEYTYEMPQKEEVANDWN